MCCLIIYPGQNSSFLQSTYRCKYVITCTKGK
uniref:Uncharacterized protein n=1 Tax=Arundo donax TaxID=35708 RepID=A0A0A9HNF5_ARUDO